MTSFATKTVASKIKTFIADEEAASAAEYGILAALVAVAIIAAVTTFGDKLKGMFGTMSTKIEAAGR